MAPIAEQLAHSKRPRLQDVGRIIAVYAAWKICLVAVVLLRPVSNYDTSTQLLFEQHGGPPGAGFARSLYDLSVSLTRWDGIYFASNSANGYVYEQQWAFSWVLTRTSSLLARVLPLPVAIPSIARHAIAGILISCLSHLGAVVVLYYFILSLLPSPLERKRQIARTTAYLHVLSPAGIFLIAPYGEATFALLNLAGMLSYTKAMHHHARDNLSGALFTVLAGFFFGLATTIRGNGLLSGIVFAWDVFDPTFNLLFGARTISKLRRLASTIVAGTLVAVGSAAPQYVAYREYCNHELQRPWCANIPPSIYSWVQEHYWDVGFLRYWTFSNLPLFALAIPVLLLLLNTGYAALHHARSLLMAVNGEERPFLRKQPEYQANRLVFEHTLERFAVLEIVLAILAATSFHVQIINRVSSGYPLWYLVLAIAIDDQSPTLECGHTRTEHYYPFRWLRGKLPKIIVQGFVVYAVIQAGLFASFLPPA